MVNDTELLIQSIDKYAKAMVSSLFGISNLPTQTLITYVIKNLTNKYRIFIDALVDENGNIDIELVENSLKETIKSKGGMTIGRVKFDDKDIEQIVSTFKELKSKA